LKINPFQVNIKEVKPTSTLFYRQQHNNFSFTTTLDYKPASERDLAGIVCLQSETFNYVFGLTRKDKEYYMVLERTEKGKSKVIASRKIEAGKTLQLQVQGTGD